MSAIPIRVGLGIFNNSATGSSEVPDPGDESQAYNWWYHWSLPAPSGERTSIAHQLEVKTQRKIRSFEQPLLVVTNNTGTTVLFNTSSRWMVKY